MKAITEFNNVDKARVMFDLFRNEIPEFITYAQTIAETIKRDKEQLIANWNNPFLSYHQWFELSERVAGAIKKYGNKLTKSGSLFADQLFDGYLAIFSNHCLEQYGANKAQSLKFKLAIDLFYLPPPPAPNNNGSFIVLELHGGPLYAGICTDQDGNNLVFETREEAEAEAADCQDGLVVSL